VPVLAEGFPWLLVAYWFSVPCRRKDNVNGWLFAKLSSAKCEVEAG